MRRRTFLTGFTGTLCALAGCTGSSSSGSDADRTTSPPEKPVGTTDQQASATAPESSTYQATTGKTTHQDPAPVPLRIIEVTLQGYDPRFYPKHDTVRLRNVASKEINPEGYTVEFDAEHQHTLSGFQAAVDADILVLSGTSEVEVEQSEPPTYVRPACFDDTSILDPQGGEVILRNPSGRVVDKKEYSSTTPETLSESVSASIETDTQGADASSSTPTEPVGTSPSCGELDQHDYPIDEVRYDSLGGFNLTTSVTTIALGDSVIFQLENDSNNERVTGNRHKYDIQRRTDSRWESIYWVGNAPIWTDGGVAHQPGGGFTWALTFSQNELERSKQINTPFRVCEKLSPGDYRFVYWGVTPSQESQGNSNKEYAIGVRFTVETPNA